MAGRCHTAGTRHGVLCLSRLSTTPLTRGGRGGAIYRAEFYPAHSDLCRSPGAGGSGGDCDQYVATNKEYYGVVRPDINTDATSQISGGS